LADDKGLVDHHHGIVSGGEDFIRLLKFLIAERLLDHGYTAIAQESDHSLTRDYPPIRHPEGPAHSTLSGQSIDHERANAQ
jgi:hypothetical protein